MQYEAGNWMQIVTNSVLRAPCSAQLVATPRGTILCTIGSYCGIHVLMVVMLVTIISMVMIIMATMQCLSQCYASSQSHGDDNGIS